MDFAMEEGGGRINETVQAALPALVPQALSV